MCELQAIWVSYLQAIYSDHYFSKPIRIPRNYLFLDNKTLQKIGTWHHLTFLWVYKCFYFRKQGAIAGHDGRVLSWRTGKLQYHASFEISKSIPSFLGLFHSDLQSKMFYFSRPSQYQIYAPPLLAQILGVVMRQSEYNTLRRARMTRNRYWNLKCP